MVASALFLLLALAWWDLLHRAGMSGPSPEHLARGMATPQAGPWDFHDVALTAVMWIVMMVAMMVPSAAPVVLLHTTVMQRRKTTGATSGLWLLGGYLLVWTGFSLLATGVQGGLHALVLLSPDLSLADPLVGGMVLVAAGIYQFTPWKHACLTHCQSPLDFLMTHWREGARGAWRMGLEHGLYCLGCCWALMLLLFVGGVMNLAWIAVLAAFVLLERIGTRGLLMSRLAGGLLVLWGAMLCWEGLRG